MDEKTTTPAVVEGKGLSLPPDVGEGFDCMIASDLVMEKISISQPSSQTKIDPGHWYDTSTDEDLGVEILFYVLAKKDVQFEGKDFTTGKPTMVQRKEILIVGEDIGFPKTVSLSSTGYWPLSALLTKLYKKYGVDNKPIFSALVKAKIDLKMGDNGKYYVPIFEGMRETTPEDLKKISAIYQEVKPIFMSNDVAESNGNPTGADFKEPDSTPDFLKSDQTPDPEIKVENIEPELKL